MKLNEIIKELKCKYYHFKIALIFEFLSNLFPKFYLHFLSDDAALIPLRDQIEKDIMRALNLSMDSIVSTLVEQKCNLKMS